LLLKVGAAAGADAGDTTAALEVLGEVRRLVRSRLVAPQPLVDELSAVAAAAGVIPAPEVCDATAPTGRAASDLRTGCQVIVKL
jgi:hypothetical protein